MDVQLSIPANKGGLNTVWIRRQRSETQEWLTGLITAVLSFFRGAFVHRMSASISSSFDGSTDAILMQWIH